MKHNYRRTIQGEMLDVLVADKYEAGKAIHVDDHRTIVALERGGFPMLAIVPGNEIYDGPDAEEIQ